MRYGEAIDLVEGLLETRGTLSHAAVRDWSYTMTRDQQLLQLMVELYAEVHRDSKKRPTPLSLGWPWPDESDVTEVEREALTQQLIARSALAGR